MIRALLVSAILLFALPAIAQERVVGRGPVCDTAEQVEKFIEHINASMDALAAADAVNEEVGNPTACGIVTMAYIRGGEVKRVKMKGKAVGVTEITVVEVMGPMGPIAIEPMKQFTIFFRPETEV